MQFGANPISYFLNICINSYYFMNFVVLYMFWVAFIIIRFTLGLATNQSHLEYLSKMY